MIEDILQAVQTALQGDSNLASVKNYHLVDGMIPGMNPTISISSNGRIRYEAYDKTQDEAHVPLRVWVYASDLNAERGEGTIRGLAEQVRYSVLSDIYLGGLVDSLTVNEIMLDSDQVNQTQLLHFAVVECDVVFYAPRQRPPAPVETADEIDLTANTETISF